MPPIDLNELSPRNRALRARRLRRLKRSVERQIYEVSPAEVASGMIREAYSFEAARRLQD